VIFGRAPEGVAEEVIVELGVRIAARWVVLFPGAAQASMMWLSVGLGSRRQAGKQDALSWKMS